MSDLVGYPEHRFSHNEAQIRTKGEPNLVIIFDLDIIITQNLKLTSLSFCRVSKGKILAMSRTDATRIKILLFIINRLILSRNLGLLQTYLHTVYPVTPNAGMFYQRGCKHLRRGNTQGKKTCNLRISLVPISNITFQTLCKRAFL